MITFREFLAEGGAATEKWKTERATSADVQAALEFTSKATGLSLAELKKNLLGSGRLTLGGSKDDSGDVDIAVKASDLSSINKKMMDAVEGKGSFNSGTKIGSYAVPVNSKRVQVDLMFVEDLAWARFMFHASESSKFPGAVRNIILFAALSRRQEPEKDVVLRDEETGKVIARASRSIHMNAGMKRLFKAIKLNKKTGKLNKNLETVTPAELETHLRTLGSSAKFSKEVDLVSDPDKVAAFIFGPGVKATDIMTAEDIIRQVKKLKNSAEILSAAKADLEKLNLPVPAEL